MVVIVYSAETGKSVAANLGRPEYSYYFVYKAFRTVLRRLAYVVETSDPEHEVDVIYDKCRRMGEACVFLSFSPPHKTVAGLRCPTSCVVAWEFPTIPTETFLGDDRNDWRNTLRRHGCVITLSSVAAQAVRRAMGDDFPVWFIPAPIWDDYVKIADSAKTAAQSNGVDLTFEGQLIDFNGCDAAWVPEAERGRFVEDRLVSKQGEPVTVHLRGTIYTTVFNPMDGRKNWPDLASGFVSAFRDTPDVTLVFKVIHNDFEKVRALVTDEILKLVPFKCRVVILRGYLDDAEYAKLIRESTYVVNSSYAEGQCLPLAEYMSAGKPGISPAHTAMADYLEESNSFVVRSSAEGAWWQHDIRQAFRTTRYRLDWESLCAAFTESYQVATHDPVRYARMSRRAVESLQRYCSTAVVEERLKTVLRERVIAPNKLQSRRRNPLRTLLRPVWRAWKFVVAPKLASLAGAVKARFARS